ncbi:cellulose binding domain-containing protein [Actinoplanes rectilineatus]|uniref:cellulose binding domain-containing protein n=1 Tax=Actinoplanes rectilineatus TaxID=113571 RepID=UPI0009F8A82A|nr:cellulose binding domain-containing protein [Actinoplanes rectilineatus]
MTRKHRTPADVVRDTAWWLATALLTGPAPEPRIRAAGAPARPRRAGRLLLVAGVLAAVSITAVLVVVQLNRPGQGDVQPDQAAGLPGFRDGTGISATSDAQAPAAGAPAVTSSSPSPSASVSASGAASSAPAPASPSSGGAVPSSGTAPEAVPLTAGYTTTPYVAGLLGYKTRVAVGNPGTVDRTGWTLAVTMPRSTLRIDNVKGASVTQQGAVWTFVPDPASAAVTAGGQVEVSFDVYGATLIDAAPSDCSIDGEPCTSS